MFFVYILISLSHGMFYIGHAEDILKRLEEHQEGRSRFTRVRGPWQLVYLEGFPTRGEAMRREYEIKRRKSKVYVQRLIQNSNGAWKELLEKQDRSVG